MYALRTSSNTWPIHPRRNRPEPLSHTRSESVRPDIAPVRCRAYADRAVCAAGFERFLVDSHPSWETGPSGGETGIGANFYLPALRLREAGYAIGQALAHYSGRNKPANGCWILTLVAMLRGIAVSEFRG